MFICANKTISVKGCQFAQSGRSYSDSIGEIDPQTCPHEQTIRDIVTQENILCTYRQAVSRSPLLTKGRDRLTSRIGSMLSACCSRMLSSLLVVTVIVLLEYGDVASTVSVRSVSKNICRNDHRECQFCSLREGLVWLGLTCPTCVASLS